MNLFFLRPAKRWLDQILRKTNPRSYQNLKSAYGALLVQNRFFLISIAALRLLTSVFDVAIGYAFLFPDIFQQHFDANFHFLSASSINIVLFVLFTRILLSVFSNYILNHCVKKMMSQTLTLAFDSYECALELARKQKTIRSDICLRFIVRDVFLDGVRYSALVVADIVSLVYPVSVIFLCLVALSYFADAWVLTASLIIFFPIMLFSQWYLTARKNRKITERLLESGVAFSRSIEGFLDNKSVQSEITLKSEAQNFRSSFVARRMLVTVNEAVFGGLFCLVIFVFFSFLLPSQYMSPSFGFLGISTIFLAISVSLKRIVSSAADIQALHPLTAPWVNVVGSSLRKEDLIHSELELVERGDISNVKDVIVLNTLNYNAAFQEISLALVRRKFPRIALDENVRIFLSPYVEVPDGLPYDESFMVVRFSSQGSNKDGHIDFNMW
ncbi:hypothetical protein N8977_04845 [Alphaproteobacteria bacterium]|nr:hypothetical protein [Alphaproteobacteria bacterium]